MPNLNFFGANLMHILIGLIRIYKFAVCEFELNQSQLFVVQCKQKRRNNTKIKSRSQKIN